MQGIQRHWARVNDVAARAIDGETVLVPIRTDPKQKVSVVSLNETGSFLWGRLGTPVTAEELARQLADAFEVAADGALADVGAFLSELRAAGLVAEGS